MPKLTKKATDGPSILKIILLYFKLGPSAPTLEPLPMSPRSRPMLPTPPKAKSLWTPLPPIQGAAQRAGNHNLIKCKHKNLLLNVKSFRISRTALKVFHFLGRKKEKEREKVKLQSVWDVWKFFNHLIALIL